MRTKLYITLAAMGVLALSCNKEPDFIPELQVTILGEAIEQGTPAELDFDYRGQSANVKVSCNTEWVLSRKYDNSEEEWLTLKATENALSISASKNPYFAPRTATVRISVKNYESVFREITITQGAIVPTISLNPKTIEFTKKGGSQTFKVSANCEWSAVSSNNAFTLDCTSGKEGETTVTLSVAENTGSEERRGTVTVTGGGNIQATLDYSQRPAFGGRYIDENGIDRGEGIVISGLTWAPVNCGFTPRTSESAGNPYGKYYQWGRKDGFNYDDEGSNVDAGIRVNVNGPVESLDKVVPEEFYKNCDNWLATTVNDLWNSGTEAEPVKTLYDPCPKNWRVPTESEMLQLIMNRSAKVTEDGITGYWFSGTTEYSADSPRLFLPFAGCIAAGSNSTDRNAAGWYWTSTVRTSNSDVPNVAIQIYTANWCNFNDWTNQRSRGYTIRCISE